MLAGRGLNEWSSFLVFKCEVILSEYCRMRETAVYEISLPHSLQLLRSLSLCTCRYLIGCLGRWGSLSHFPIRRSGIKGRERKIVKTAIL